MASVFPVTSIVMLAGVVEGWVVALAWIELVLSTPELTAETT